MPVERVMGPNCNNMGNYGDLQPIARNMKPTLWVSGEDFSFGLVPQQSLIKPGFHHLVLLARNKKTKQKQLKSHLLNGHLCT